MTAKELLQWLADSGDKAHDLLRRLGDGFSVPTSALDAFGDEKAAAMCLLLRQLPGATPRFDMRPSLRNAAIDACTPAHFRRWQAVERARQQIRDQGLRGERAAQHLAGCLGVTLQQASRHLDLFPV